MATAKKRTINGRKPAAKKMVLTQSKIAEEKTALTKRLAELERLENKDNRELNRHIIEADKLLRPIFNEISKLCSLSDIKGKVQATLTYQCSASLYPDIFNKKTSFPADGYVWVELNLPKEFALKDFVNEDSIVNNCLEEEVGDICPEIKERIAQLKKLVVKFNDTFDAYCKKAKVKRNLIEDELRIGEFGQV